MKNKGFTIVELLAVIVILSVVLLVSVPAVFNIISSSRESISEEQKTAIVSAARSWGISNLYPVKEDSTVNVYRKGEFDVLVPIGSRFRGGDHTYIVTENIENTHDSILKCEQASATCSSYSGSLEALSPVEGLTTAVLTDVIEKDNYIASQNWVSIDVLHTSGFLRSNTFKNLHVDDDKVAGVCIFYISNQFVYRFAEVSKAGGSENQAKIIEDSCQEIIEGSDDVSQD